MKGVKEGRSFDWQSLLAHVKEESTVAVNQGQPNQPVHEKRREVAGSDGAICHKLRPIAHDSNQPNVRPKEHSRVHEGLQQPDLDAVFLHSVHTLRVARGFGLLRGKLTHNAHVCKHLCGERGGVCKLLLHALLSAFHAATKINCRAGEGRQRHECEAEQLW